MKLENVTFVRSAAEEAGFPGDNRRRIVFAGRSNVGKSSTINALTGKKGFARVSSMPGKTVFVNLFLVDERMWLVDLPGYGYSKTSKAERERYSALIDAYLLHDMPNISKFVMIVDIRHKPTADDKIMCDWAKAYHLPLVVIANKSDKLKPSQIAPAVELIRSELGLSQHDMLIPFSAENNTGRDAVIAAILAE